ncbi:hypothetical protein B484DRAFT_452416 [Ochromonadaceae sp. CCMP2298]|nr:hypothetical protein B484DRAFT_452416 [Ochromonadaceae sp. CCMP2298]
MGMVPMPMNWEMGNWNQPGMPMPIPMPMQGMGMGMQGIPMQTPMHIPIMTAAMPSVRGSPPTVGSPSQPYSPSRQSSPPPMSDSEAGSQEQIVAAVKTQIEYYFSAGNLQGDPYLRRQMDHQGFVPLLQLSRFRRLVQLGASPELILDAVRQSSELHVEEGAQGGGGPKVRCLNDPTRWVLNEDSLVGAQ